jgi:hypothetical protein
VLSAAGRGVVQAAGHDRCVLVQCTKSIKIILNDSFSVNVTAITNFERLVHCQYNGSAITAFSSTQLGHEVIQLGLDLV